MIPQISPQDNGLEARLTEFQAYALSFFPLTDNRKTPRSSWEIYQHRRPDAREIGNWIYLGHQNYGIVTGSISGNIIGIDLDPQKMEADLQEYAQRWPTGYIVRTPTGGLHLVYRVADDIRIKTKADALGPGIDTRGEGGYLVAPGSTVTYIWKDAIKKNVPDGFTGTYEQIGGGEITPIPDELLGLLRERNLIIGQPRLRPDKNQLSRSYSDVTERQIAEMLSFIPTQGGYDYWLSVLMAVHSVLPDQRGINLCEAWSPGYEGEVAEKFDSFDKGYSGPKVTLGTLVWLARQHGYTPTKPVHRAAILKAPMQAHQNIHKPYFSADDFPENDDLIVIGDMGTGKSTSVAQLNNQKLIPSHRTRLSKSLAKPFEAVNYRNQNDEIRSSDELRRSWNQGHNLTIVINSLHRLGEWGRLPHVPLLFIDEIRQVLAQLGGETFTGAEAETAYNTLVALIRHAERVIVADAHADDIVTDFLQEIRGVERVKVIHNSYNKPRGPLTIYRHRDRLIAHACELIDHNEGTIVIPTNSKTQAKLLEQYFTARYGEQAVMCIHQDTTDDKARYFIEHITDEITQYRVVIYSPTLGSGIDISQDSKGRRVEIRAICAVLMADVIPASDCHQLINRCRHVQETHIFIQQSDGHREIDPDVIYERRLTEAAKTGHVAHFDAHGVRVASDSQKQLHRLLSRIEASDNASLNDLATDFRSLAKGYASIVVDDGIDETTRDDLHDIAQIVGEIEKAAVLRAEPVDPSTYKRLSALNQLTADIQAGHLRWQIEYAAGQTITPMLYDHLHDPRDRAKIYQLTDYRYATDAELQERDRLDTIHPIGKRRHYTRRNLLIERFIKDVFGTEGIHTRPMSKAYIENAVNTFMALNGDDMFATFEKRRDASTQPMAIFRWVMTDLLGFLIVSERKMFQRKQTYVYSVNASSLRQQMTLADKHHARRQQENMIQTSLPLQTSERSEK